MRLWYFKSTLYPALISILATGAWAVYDNRDYKSEWQSGNENIGLSLVLAMGYLVIMMIACLPIFLVDNPRVQRSKLLTFFSWFLVPVGWIVFVFALEIRFDLKFEGRIGAEIMYNVWLNLPYLVGLVLTYVQYRKDKR